MNEWQMRDTFAGLTSFDLKYVRCIFCERPLEEKFGIVRIVDYKDRYCREEFNYYFAHEVCICQALELYREHKEKGESKKNSKEI